MHVLTTAERAEPGHTHQPLYASEVEMCTAAVVFCTYLPLAVPQHAFFYAAAKSPVNNSKRHTRTAPRCLFSLEKYQHFDISLLLAESTNLFNQGGKRRSSQRAP